MGKYDSFFITAKDGIYDASMAHAGGRSGKEGRDLLFVSGGLLGPRLGISWGMQDNDFSMSSSSDPVDFEHVLGWIGADMNKPDDFDAEIEFTLGGEKHIITEPTFVRVPALVDDGPVIIKRVGKPMNFFHIFFTAGFRHLFPPPQMLADQKSGFFSKISGEFGDPNKPK